MLVGNLKSFSAIVFFLCAPLCAIEMESSLKKDIHVVEIDASMHLDDQGYFADTKSVHILLQKIPGAFPSPKVRRLSKKLGKCTTQLFDITCGDNTAYILKGITPALAHDEIKRLERARRLEQLTSYIHPKSKDRLQFIFPLMYLSYLHLDEEHIMAILVKASGTSLKSLERAFNNQPDNKRVHTVHSKAYYALGATLAHFYTEVGTLDKTIVHGDLNIGNILYDEHTGLITLIDNEAIRESHIGREIGTLFLTGLRTADKAWYSLTIPSFIAGFLQTFPENEQASVFLHAVSLFNKWTEENIYAGGKNRYQRLKLINAELENLKTKIVDQKATALSIAKENPALSALVTTYT